MLTKPVYPRSVGTCPVCNGTKRQDAGQSPYRTHCAGYSPADNTFPCQNCGGQYMAGRPTGLVWHDKQDQPCHHQYEVTKIANCYREYTCTECGDTYSIDSGD